MKAIALGLLVLAALQSVARAQEDADQIRYGSLEDAPIELLLHGAPVMERYQRIRELEEAYEAVDVDGPSATIGSSSFLMATGSVLLLTAPIACFWESGPCRTRNALRISGAVVLSAGLVGLSIGVVRKKRAVAKRREIQQQLDAYRAFEAP